MANLNQEIPQVDPNLNEPPNVPPNVAVDINPTINNGQDRPLHHPSDPVANRGSSDVFNRSRTHSGIARSSSIPLPALSETLINWKRVDKAYSWCHCFAFILSVILVATTGSFLFGFNTALLNTSVNYIAADMDWCGLPADVECDKAVWYKSFLSTAVFLGAAFGALTGGRFIVNGHRMVLLASLLVFFVGVVSSVVATGFAPLLWARLIVGYGVGVTSVVTPGYISEMAPKEKRGRYGVFHQLVLVIGQLLAVALGLAFRIMPDPDDRAAFESWTMPKFDSVWWRVMLGFGIIPVILALVFFGPIYSFETPQYYIRRNDEQNARELLKRIHAKEDVSTELAELKEQAADEETKASKPPLRQLLKRPGYSKALWVGIGVSVFQQITGINAFIASSNKLFAEAGLGPNLVTIASICLSVVNLLCTFIPMVLIERLGRRTLFIIGSIGMTVSVAPATIMYWAQWNQDPSQALTIVAVVGACLFVVFFAVAAGPVTWLYLFEIFPMDMKAQASSICVAINWLASILMVFGAGLLDSKYAYTIFFACSAAYIIFVFVCIKETRGRVMGDSPYTAKQ